MIKFRAWDKEDKAYTANEYLVEIVPDGTDFDLVSSVDFDDSTGLVIEQFTGLTDANGKEVYEGDIIKSNYKYAQPKVSLVIREDGNSYIVGEDMATGNEMLVSDHIGEIEVIGNVHENSELLEEDNEKF